MIDVATLGSFGSMSDTFSVGKQDRSSSVSCAAASLRPVKEMCHRYKLDVFPMVISIFLSTLRLEPKVSVTYST